MNGAEKLVRVSVAAGVRVCFANPGTTEMHLLAALDAAPGMRAVLGLFEGVCTGAADGYARMTGRPAATLLHLGPGFANGIANLHNARRAHTPVLNWVGDHARWHRAADAPLASDIESLAAPLGWLRVNETPAALARDGLDALRAACASPGQIATLIIPADCAWEELDGTAGLADTAAARATSQTPAADARAVTTAAHNTNAHGTANARTLTAVADETVRAAAEQLAQKPCALLLGDAALGERGLRAARRLEAHGACSVWLETFPARIERGGTLPDFPRLPYFPEPASVALAQTRTLLLAGARDPVAFFGYAGQPSRIAPESARVFPLAHPGEDAPAALEALADFINAPAPPAAHAHKNKTPPRATGTVTGALTVAALGQILAAQLPEHAIVTDESITAGLAFNAHADAAARHTQLGLTGGAIGMGLPCAVGAALACPERPVIAFQADGAALYTMQALWTMARENLNVTIVLCANRSYRILQTELARAGVTKPGPQAAALTELDRPAIDWVAAARTFGVPGVRANTAESFTRALTTALTEPGPYLIEAQLR